MTALRIGVNALYLIPGRVGGTEIYLRNLLRALREIDGRNEYFVYTNKETGADLVPEADNFHHVPQGVWAENRPARLLWEQIRLPRQVKFDGVDVLFNPGFTSPAVCACPSVTVFHDLQHKRHPEYFRWFDLPFWNYFLWQSARSSASIVTVSKATANDMIRYYPATRGRINVVHHGVDGLFREIRLHRADAFADPRFLLCVSTLHPHKNIERLILAFERFHHECPEFRLVIAGMHGFHARAVDELITERGLRDCVSLPGWIPVEKLVRLYTQAHAFIYPSTFEGFGMPVLEALAAGVPTACSSIPPLREVAGGAAEYFDPSDETALYEAMLRVAFDQPTRKRLAVDGPQRAANFSWERSARETLLTLERAGRNERSARTRIRLP